MLKFMDLKGNKGITILTLSVTIIILLILAGISVATLTGNNGLIANAGKAKEQAEIDEEREIVETSTVQAMGQNKYGNVEQLELQEKLDINAGDGKTEVLEDEGKIIVKFIENSRFYEVDSNGNISKIDVVIDNNPGNIETGINGKKLKGTEESPFEIWCIEDLIEWSQNYSKYNSSYINLCKDLNFKSILSYSNSESTDYGNLNGDETTEKLINEMQSGTGFPEISNFEGIFDGQEYKISNLYRYNAGGMFGTNGGTIKNLSIDVELYLVGATGGLCSTNSGNIENVKIYGKIEGIGTAAGGSYAGGVCYRNLGNIIRTYNYAEIESISAFVGGICGQNNGTIEKCGNEGNVCGTNDIGGIVGINYSKIKECINKGNISTNVSGGYHIGGIAGRNQDSTTIIEDCYNLGAKIKGVNCGGIVGPNYGKVSNCYSISTINGSNLGGIAAPNNGSIVNCFYVKNGNYDIQYGGTGTIENSGEKTESEMKENTILDLLDFGNAEKVWKLNNEINDGFPYLSWEE